MVHRKQYTGCVATSGGVESAGAFITPLRVCRRRLDVWGEGGGSAGSSDLGSAPGRGGILLRDIVECSLGVPGACVMTTRPYAALGTVLVVVGALLILATVGILHLTRPRTPPDPPLVRRMGRGRVPTAGPSTPTAQVPAWCAATTSAGRRGSGAGTLPPLDEAFWGCHAAPVSSPWWAARSKWPTSPYRCTGQGGGSR